MTRELFVYWHTGPALAAGALAAARCFQRTLCDAHPGLVARLYRRDDAACGRVTVMETYAAPAGLDDSIWAAVRAPAWCPGTRHLESFDPV